VLTALSAQRISSGLMAGVVDLLPAVGLVSLLSGERLRTHILAIYGLNTARAILLLITARSTQGVVVLTISADRRLIGAANTVGLILILQQPLVVENISKTVLNLVAQVGLILVEHRV
jgi:hypothetical protein